VGFLRLIVFSLWVYYLAQIFLLGAEFAKVYANRHSSKRGDPVAEVMPATRGTVLIRRTPSRGRGAFKELTGAGFTAAKWVSD
jgi:hypothetical protein